jgi:uncharacterized membrane protein SirB2
MKFTNSVSHNVLFVLIFTHFWFSEIFNQLLSNGATEWVQHWLTGTFLYITVTLTREKQSKAVPLHAMEAHWGRGGIAPTHS